MSESSNLPAIPATVDVDSWLGVVADVAKLATYIAGTEFVPKSLRDSPAAVAAAILYGREVGLGPMSALTQTHVIEGKPSMSANGMRALVFAAGHEIQTVESTGAICRMRGRRRGTEEWSAEVTWTIDMARAAGLLTKSNWKNFPRQMLTARCSAELCTRDFPDVVLGFRSVEELEDMGDDNGIVVPGFIAPTGTQKVGRKRAATKTKALPAPDKPSERPAVSGPPLPGEDGYDTALPVPGGSGEPVPVGSGETEGEAVEPEPTGTTETSPGDSAGFDSPPDESPGGFEPVEQQQMDAEAADERRGPRKMSRPQTRMLFALLHKIGVDDVDEERHLIASKIIGRHIGSFTDLLHADATTLIDTLGRIPGKEELTALLDQIDYQESLTFNPQEETHNG